MKQFIEKTKALDLGVIFTELQITLQMAQIIDKRTKVNRHDKTSELVTLAGTSEMYNNGNAWLIEQGLNNFQSGKNSFKAGLLDVHKICNAFIELLEIESEGEEADLLYDLIDIYLNTKWI